MDLEHAIFLNDHYVDEFSLFIGDLVSVNLSQCLEITYSSLFALVRNCPSLSEIKMENIGSKSLDNSDSLPDFGVYPQLKSLYLAYNTWKGVKHVKENCSQLREHGYIRHYSESVVLKV
ncbi:putative leucine-rich repeat domain, L domain-containing protein [Medicago truncatula]|uniref:Putative leucine-rich repeat domain, L domain-containing protein n=1 Tax=Medicago truncatula TaxID=3880 RepID=A0A396GZU9_MEDTR|nr:putative leucine-rich repeat domain, L domain-containing protein [Medicago truncatula]